MKIPKSLKGYESYLRSRGKLEGTIETYLLEVTQFLQHIKKVAKNIRITDIEKFSQYCRETYNTNSLTPKFCAVKSYLKYLKKYELLERINREEILKQPPSKLPDKDVLTKEEVHKIFRVSRNNLRDNAILKTLYYTTQRRSSIIDMNLDDINWDTEEVRIRAKGDKEYTVDINPIALESIRDYLEVRPKPKVGHENALFLTTFGTRMGGQRLWELVKVYGIKAGITKRIYPHLFRATAITHLDDVGMTEHQIMLQSGHSDAKSLNTYIHPDRKKVKANVRKALSIREPKPIKKPDIPVDPNLKAKKDTSDTDNYIARLEERLQQLESKLREKEHYMYG